MNKKEKRANMLQELKKQSKPEYEQYSYEIATKLFQDETWIKAHTIGITVSSAIEVDTYQIIRKAWELGKRVVVPKCHPKEKSMTFHVLNQFTQLESVYYGLLEPIEKLTCQVNNEEIDLLIVPGLIFNNEGYRIGFGGGYYDRYLTVYKGQTVSLVFPFQIHEQIPIEEHDIPVQKLITLSNGHEQ